MPRCEAADRPLIVTLSLDPAAQRIFDALRTAHFPRERLHVGAHVTMFHALPPERLGDVLEESAVLCAGTAPFPVAVTRVRFLGHGVAYDLASPEAEKIRARLKSRFAPYLTRQDRAPWTPHLTVQNKVAPELARKTMADLPQQPVPGGITAIGLHLWRYEGGPWTHIRDVAFAGSEPDDPDTGTAS